MSFPRYPAYKDSGVEWLGEVPEHWGIDRLKASIVSSRNGIWGNEAQGDDDDIACVRVADFDRIALSVVLDEPTIRSVTTKEREGRVLERGNLLLEKSGGGENQPVGCVVLYDTDQPAVCSNFVARVQLKNEMHPSYWRYVHSAAYAVRLTVGSINQTSGIQNLDQDRYFDERAPFPPPAEQVAIATFLDRETAKIDALVAEQKELIELLKEKRQAVISHAVTKGLDPSVPMKYSGVDWLGEVPAHWVKKAIKFVLRAMVDTEHKTAPFYDDGTYLVVRTSNVRNGALVLSDAKYTDAKGFEEWTRRGVPQAGDIVFTREAPAGEACVIPQNIDLCLGQRTVLFQVDREQLVAEFAVWSIYAGVASEFIANLSQGSTVPHFNMSDIGSIPLLLPSMEEQKRIVDFVEERTTRFDALIAEALKASNLLREHRSALISAAVTGQVDVRQHAP